MVISIGKRSLGDEGTGVSSLARGRMVGAGVSAFSEDVGNVAVLKITG